MYTRGLILPEATAEATTTPQQQQETTFPGYCQMTLSGGSLLTNEVLVYGAKLLEQKTYFNVDSFERVREITKQGVSRTKQKVRLKLPWGHSTIRYRNKPIDVHCMRFYPPLAGKRDNGIWLTEVTLMTVHGAKHLISFIKAAKNHAKIKKTSNDVIVYVQNDGYWPVLNKLPKRSLKTIYLPGDTKERLVADIQRFLDSEADYQKFGIPYKRNYLFEGGVGLGKSSSIFAIASHFDLNVGLMSFGNRIDDALFMYALSHLPEKTILVLEDIDCLFQKRQKQKDSHNHLTFSGLLNGLDGIARRHGLLTFMTTNYLDRLDSALIRPGRVDYRVHFDSISDDQIHAMFAELAPNQSANSKDFIKRIRPYRAELTPAVLQQFLFMHKTTEGSILDHIDDIREICNQSHRHREPLNDSTKLVYL